MSVFHLLDAEERDYAPAGIAYGPDGGELTVLPPSGTKVTHWIPLELVLRDGGFADNLANDMGLRLFSDKLRTIIDEVRSEQDVVQWLDATVFDGNEVRPYHVLHFPVDFPVVDEARSIMAGKMVVKPVLLTSAVRGRNVFTLPETHARRLFVSQKLRDAIREVNCTGVDFSKVPLST